MKPGDIISFVEVRTSRCNMRNSAITLWISMIFVRLISINEVLKYLWQQSILAVKDN